MTLPTAQRSIKFDQIYGWENTLLEPKIFWSRVPKALKAIYHFFNVPISANINDGESVLRVIEQVATPDDFVSFKLDIDTPSIEIPVSMDILNSNLYSSLIDEFFFELHFVSEFMSGTCGWDWKPLKWNDFTLDLNNTLHYFQ